MKWPEIEIGTREGLQRGIAPQIISASRSTDIAAFYAEWFLNRLREGYVKWINPFNQRPQYVSLQNARVIVFWSKNPRPLMRFLGELDERSLAYYFHFTLNDYESDGLEPGVPPLDLRIQTFRELSEQIGRDRIIWRFDPLVLTGGVDVGKLLAKIKRVGDQIAGFTAKLVFSFADISCYRKVQNNLGRAGVAYREFNAETTVEAAAGIAALCEEWGIAASTCAEVVDLSRFGIDHNRCIDDNLILKLTGNDAGIQRLFGVDTGMEGDLFGLPEKAKRVAKDPGQRAECGCVFSKDIGQYNTCPHLCLYCYANASETVVRKNISLSSVTAESILVDSYTKAVNSASDRL